MYSPLFFKAEKIEVHGLSTESPFRYMCFTKITIFYDQTQFLIVLKLSLSLSFRGKMEIP